MGTCILFAMATADSWAGPEITAPTGTSTSEPGPTAVPVDAEKAGPKEALSSGAVQTIPTVTSPPTGDQGLVDVLHNDITSGFLSTAVWLDSFFGDARYESESNLSRFKVTFQRLYEDGAWTRYRPDYELRLVLPQLRQLTRLTITTALRDDVDNVSVLGGAPPAPLPKPEDRSMTTALQFFLPSTAQHNTSIRGGIKYHLGQIEYFAGPRYRFYQPLDSWGLRFTQDVLWGSLKGWQSFSWLDLERPIPHDLFFRATLSGEWTEGVDGYLAYLGFMVRQPLDPNRAIQYEWVNSFQSRPIEELTEVKFIFRYRQRFWRDWLFLEIAPQYRYPRDHSFDAVPGILFKVEVVFGENSSFF